MFHVKHLDYLFLFESGRSKTGAAAGAAAKTVATRSKICSRDGHKGKADVVGIKPFSWLMINIE